MESYPFLDFVNEDKSRYQHAKDAGYVDDDDLFLIGDSGGFLMNIRPGWRFVNTGLFYEMADYFRTHKGQYTSYKVDSIPHRQLRRREQHRRKHGFSAPCLQDPNGTIHNVRITGSHYNFLNYIRMEQLDESTINRGNTNTAKKHYDFPKFFDAQFWTFHIMEFAEKNGFHLLIDKTRRGGFSYMMAADSANAVNCESRKVVIHVAVDKNILHKQVVLQTLLLIISNFMKNLHLLFVEFLVLLSLTFVLVTNYQMVLKLINHGGLLLLVLVLPIILIVLSVKMLSK